MANAQKLIQAGKLDKAIKELERLLEEDPKDVRTLLKIGDLHAKEGHRAEAAAAYGKVAGFYSEQGFYLKAVAVYKQILRVDPNLVEVNLKLAELYHQLGLMNDSVQQYQLVANALDRQGRTKESLGVLRKMVDLDAENVASRIKLAELYSSQQMVAEAVKEFETAAQQLKKQDRHDDYVKVAERLLFHDQSRVEVARELANMYLQRGDPKRALGKLQICFKANSRDQETLVLLAQAFQDLEQLPKAASVLRELAKIYTEEGQTSQAEATWRRVLALAPDDEEAQRALGMAPARPQPAYSGFEDEVVQQEPSFVGAFPTAAPSNSVVMPLSPAMMAASGRQPAAPPPPPPTNVAPPRAPPVAAKGLGAAPANPTTPQDQVTKLLMETDVYVKYGLREKAIDHVKKVFALDPEHLEAHEKLKGLFIKAGNIQGAADEVVTCFRIAMSREDRQRARGYLGDLSSISSTHPAIASMRQELDGVATAAPVAINVMRRAGVSMPPPPPEVVEEEVAVVVDSADSAEAEVELQVSADSETAALDDYQPLGTGDLELPSDLASDVGDAFADGAPPPDAFGGDEQVEGSDEFADFMGTGGSDDALAADDPFAVVPGTGGEELPSDDEGMVPASDPFAEVGDAFSASSEEFPAASTDQSQAYADEFESGPATVALDRHTIEAAVAAQQHEEQALVADDVDPAALGLADEDSAAQDLADAFGTAGDDPFASDAPADQFNDVTEPPADPFATTGDDPFAADSVSSDAESSFASDDEFVPEPEPEAIAEPEPEPEPLDEPEPEPAPVAAKPAAKKAPAGPDMALEFFPDEVAEAEFFITNGLFDEAREILQRIQEDVDESPKVAYLLRKADALENGEDPPPEDEDASEASADDAPSDEQDNAFDLAQELADELGDVAPAAEGDEPMQVSVESVLAEFKKGVDRVVAEDDADTHHDLGIAYKEMGLLDDAVGEFERSAQNAKKAADALYMIGLCRMEQGQSDDAIEAFSRALQAEMLSDHQRAAVGYELGNALESMARLGEALQAFQDVGLVDPEFKDVATRVQALKGKVGSGGRGGNGSHPGKGPAGGGGEPGKKGKNIGYI